MKLSTLETGEKAVIAKVCGHGSFKKRLIEMGFITGKTIKVILNAPLKDPIEYEILGYKLSLRREEAEMIEVISAEEAQEGQETPAVLSFEEMEETLANIAIEKHKRIRVALIGNPNCGKTSLFNIASGSKERVGNYSGVTVDAKEGNFEYKGYKFTLIDLPGTYSLSAYSPEELYVRKNLTENVPDIVINVVDATNLERNLYLTSQIIDMNLQIVMALNMWDEFKKGGDKLDIDLLGSLLGMPICPTVSRNGEGIDNLFDKVIDLYEKKVPKYNRHIKIWHGEDLEQSINIIKNLIKKTPQLRIKYSTRYLAIKYLERDKEIEKVIEALPNRDEIIAARVREDAHYESLYSNKTDSAIIDAKYGFINGALKETFIKAHKTDKNTITDKIDRVVTNKWAAFPIFLLILYVMFKFTFTLGEYPKGWIEWLVEQIKIFAGISMQDGIIKDLVTDGAIAGVGSVLVFLPDIMILYLFISLLEDTGYMSRAAFIIDKLMHRIGLHGKSFIPMVMGFGCNVPAIMATRSIESPKSRFLTIMILPFMSCTARLTVFVLLAGAFFKENAALVLLGLYVLGIVVGIAIASVLGKFVKEDDLPFVMELPPYRVPTAKATWRHTWEKGKQYLQKMGTTILLCSVIIWFLGYFPKNKELETAKTEYAEMCNSSPGTGMTNEEKESRKLLLSEKIDRLYEIQQENSYIGRFGKALEPIMNPLGFHWKMNVGLLTGVAAKEIVVSTLGIMFSQGSKVSSGEELEEDLTLQESLRSATTPAGALAYMIFILLYFPCVATFVAIKNETGQWKMAILACANSMLVAWILAFMTYNIFSLFT